MSKGRGRSSMGVSITTSSLQLASRSRIPLPSSRVYDWEPDSSDDDSRKFGDPLPGLVRGSELQINSGSSDSVMSKTK